MGYRLVDTGEGQQRLYRDGDENGYFVQGDQYGSYGDSGFNPIGSVSQALAPPAPSTNSEGALSLSSYFPQSATGPWTNPLDAPVVENKAWSDPTTVAAPPAAAWVDPVGPQLDTAPLRQQALDAIRSGQGVDLNTFQNLAPRASEILPTNPAQDAFAQQFDSVFGTKTAKDLAMSYGQSLGYSPDQVTQMFGAKMADQLQNAWANGNEGITLGGSPLHQDTLNFLAQQKGIGADDPQLKAALGAASALDDKYKELRSIEGHTNSAFQDIGGGLQDLGPLVGIVANIVAPGSGALFNAGLAALPSALQGDFGGALKNAGLSYLPSFLKDVQSDGILGAVGKVKDTIAGGYDSVFGSTPTDAVGADVDIDVPESTGGGGGLQAPKDYLYPSVSVPGYEPDDLGSGLSAGAAQTGFNSGLSSGILDLIGSGLSGPVTDAGLGLHLPANNNLPSMGGGQGLTVPGEGTDRFTGEPTVGSVGQNGYQASIDTPVLGNPTSFINDPNKVNVTPAATPPTLAEQLGGSGNLPKAILGATGILGSLAGADKAASAAVGGSGGNPWLDTSDEFLRNMGTLKNKNKADPFMTGLQQIYGQIDPMGRNYGAQVDTGALPGYAMGGSACAMVTCGCGPSPFQNQYQPFNGNIQGYAKGGLPEVYKEAAPKGHHPEFVTGLTGYYACGGGTGQSDDIPAMLHEGDYVMDADVVSALGDGSSKAGRDVLNGFLTQVKHSKSDKNKPIPARIADGEYVFPEAFVTAIGGGDNKHGAKILDGLREKLREHKRSAPTGKIPPKALSPLDYLKKAK